MRLNEITEALDDEKADEFHRKLDDLVHSYFGHSSDEKKAMDDEEQVDEAAKKGLYYYVNKRKKAGTSRPKNHPDAPSAEDWKNAAKTAKK